jgi:drug/metabolite transporter (DMT)-like permease
MTARPEPAAFAAPALFVLLWSSGFIGAKLGLPYAEPLTFLSLRFTCVLALMIPLVLVARAPWPASPRDALHIAVAGVLIQAGYLGGVFSAIHQGMSAGVVALIVGIQPLLTATVAGRMLGERVSAQQWIGFTLGLTGVTLVVWQKMSLHGMTAVSLALALIALFSITFGTLYQKRYCPRFDARSGSVIQFAASFVLLLPLAWATETMRIEWTGKFLFALGWLVLVLSVGAISLLYWLLRHGAAANVARLFYLVPPTTALMAWLLFGEKLDLLALVGMALICAGVMLARRNA